MLQKINRARAHHGLRPLRLSPSLRRSSGRFAHHLMAADVFVVAPILLGFLFLQRHLSPTSLMTGVK